MSNSGTSRKDLSLPPFDPSGKHTRTELAERMAELQFLIEITPHTIAGHGVTGYFTARVVSTATEHRPSLFTETGANLDWLMSQATEFIKTSTASHVWSLPPFDPSTNAHREIPADPLCDCGHSLTRHTASGHCTASGAHWHCGC